MFREGHRIGEVCRAFRLPRERVETILRDQLIADEQLRTDLSTIGVIGPEHDDDDLCDGTPLAPFEGRY